MIVSNRDFVSLTLTVDTPNIADKNGGIINFSKMKTIGIDKPIVIINTKPHSINVTTIVVLFSIKRKKRKLQLMTQTKVFAAKNISNWKSKII